MSDAALTVAEVFGPTMQGEGPSAGRRAAFIRLGGCNLHCSWCDTPYTWDASRFDLRVELTAHSASTLARLALASETRLVVITGGEPLLQNRRAGWTALLDELADAGVDVEIETNGTIAPIPHRARITYNVSPKLAHAGDHKDARIRPEALAAFAALAHANAAVFKFVVRDIGDVVDVSVIVARHKLPPHSVWIMPVGTTTEELTDWFGELADHAIAFGYNVTNRLHILAWGEGRGR